MQKLIQRGAYLHSLGSNFPKDLPLPKSQDLVTLVTKQVKHKQYLRAK